jgi:predicted nuclease of predicted toxin-antitoxin system
LNGFVFDENLPRNITFPVSLPLIHASDIGVSLSDTALWEYARVRGYAIVSKEADFSHRIMLGSPPPWIVHLRFGNLRRRDFMHCLRACGRQWKCCFPRTS